jgi:outer membrane protein assembly factor BamB
VISLSRYYNQVKPLAMADPGGFVINSGVLVGAFDQRWVGAMAVTTQKIQWWLDGQVDMTTPPGSFGSWIVMGFRDGKVRKVEALTGKVVWTASLDSFSERQFLLNGTTLYVMTAAQWLYALDFQTGKTLWMFDAGFPDGLAIHGGVKPLVFDNKVIVGIASGELLAVQAETGKLVWRYNPAYNDARFHDLIGEMVVRNSRLLVSRYDGLVASLDLGSGVRSIVWQDQLPGVTASTFRGGRYYVGALDGSIYAYDADSGRRLYRFLTGSPVASITAGETSIYIGGGDGRITVLDATDGELQWSDDLGSALASIPILTEQAIYYSTGLKNIYGYKIH